jgi:hypothetical protein
MTVSRLGRALGLQPHRTETFKLSPDPWLVEKVRDLVSLYRDPPGSSGWARRTRSRRWTAPNRDCRCGTTTHDYTRHGTTTLFAALSTLDGVVIGDCSPQHRHQEFIRFLKRINQETPAAMDLHRIAANGAINKHPHKELTPTIAAVTIKTRASSPRAPRSSAS